jgi:DNA repair protein RadA/Sms
MFRCEACDAVSPKWAGRCAGCGEWNTLGEVPGPGRGELGSEFVSAHGAPVPLADVDPHGSEPRPTGVAELDRVLAGGLVAGSVTLLFGEPGIGKSTLLLQALTSWCRGGGTGLLVSAEESGPQVRARATRLGPLPASLLVSATADVEDAERAILAAQPDLVVVDSVQTVVDSAIGGGAGTLSQVRACAERLTRLSRRLGTALVLVGHVTKAGDPAGPRTLEHLVDTVLEFEGDRHHSLRVLRAVKHRFGPTGEVGLFEMGDTGLHDVVDPGALLLGDRRPEVPGSVVTPVLQGRRALVVEIQALASEVGSYDAPLRPSAQGVDAHRLAFVLAVLRCRADVDLRGFEIFVSATGGISATEPATDLPLALAVTSAATAVPLPANMVALGEIGLAGELRQVPHIGRRLTEAARLGFTRALVPSSTPEDAWPMAVERVGTVAEAIAAARRRSSMPDPSEGGGEAPGLAPGTIPAWSSVAASL